MAVGREVFILGGRNDDRCPGARTGRSRGPRSRSHLAAATARDASLELINGPSTAPFCGWLAQLYPFNTSFDDCLPSLTKSQTHRTFACSFSRARRQRRRGASVRASVQAKVVSAPKKARSVMGVSGKCGVRYLPSGLAGGAPGAGQVYKGVVGLWAPTLGADHAKRSQTEVVMQRGEALAAPPYITHTLKPFRRWACARRSPSPGPRRPPRRPCPSRPRR